MAKKRPSGSRRNRVRWTDEGVLEAIRARNDDGRSLDRTDAYSTDPSLVCAAEYRFGTWLDAVRASIGGAQITSPRAARQSRNRKREERTPWTPEKIKACILLRLQAREPLDVGSVMRDDPDLASAAYHHLAGYYEALEAFGIDSDRWRKYKSPRTPGKRPQISKTLILDRILERRSSGRSLEAADVLAEDRELLMAANRLCGSWERAVASAPDRGRKPKAPERA